MNWCILALAGLVGLQALGQEAKTVKFDRRIPDEYETTGGHALGFGNSAVAAVSGISAVKTNPAMLPMQKTYDVAGGYHWPTAGREFFQAGVVDTQSSDIAAGVTYHGFSDDYGEENIEVMRDARVKRRASLGLAKTLKKLAVGVNGQYVESEPKMGTEESEKGTTIGFGVAGLLTPQIRFGASVENMANKKVASLAPRMVRAGFAYLFGNGDVSVHFDVRQRERIPEYEQSVDVGETFVLAGINEEEEAKLDEEYQRPELMGIGSFSARVYDMIRLLGAYGQSLDGPERSSLSGGVAMVSGQFSFAYTASRPYMSEPDSHQAISASFAIKL